MSRLVRDSALTFLAEVGVAATTFLSGVIIARMTGTDGKGIYALVIGFGSLAALVLGFRWQRPVGYFLAKDEKNLPGIMGSILLLGALAVTLAIAIYRVYPEVYTQYVLRDVDHFIVEVSIALIGTTFLWQGITAVHAGLRDFRWRAIFLILSAGLLFLVNCLLYCLGRRDIASYLIAALLATGIFHIAWLAGILVAYRIRPAIDFSLLRRMSRYSALTYATLILDMMIIRMDIFILNYLQGAGPVGIYSIAVGLSNQLGRISTILGTVIFNRVSANEMGQGALTAKIVRISLLVMCALGMLLALLGTYLVGPVYGAEFVTAIKPLYVMIPAIVFLGLFRVLASDIDGRGKPGYASLCSMVSAIFIVVLDFWWIPKWGVMGAAWASLVSYAAAFVAGAYAFYRLTGVGFCEILVPRKEDVLTVWSLFVRYCLRRKKSAMDS